ncbi:MAG: ATP-binding protein, partial [Candidatus Omnitrophica bacterium]|nr:ATP-binding protein [Candidatus Omnitrophota bacterium]
AVPAREIFINAFDSIKEKAEAKVEGGKLYGEISITVEKVMDGLAITILDNGPGIITPSELGIPPASLTGYAQYGSKVTDIPVSTKIGGGGSGLSLVRSMLVSSGGHISWRKRSGGGTRVKLIVPVSSIMDEDLQRLGLGERRKVGSRGVNLEAGKVQIFADKYPVEVTVEEIYREYVRRVEKGIIGPDVRGTYASIPVLADSPEKWPEHFKAGWEADFIKELSGLDSDALAEKFLARHKGNAQKNLRFMRTVSDDPPNLMDIWGNVASYVEHPDYMSLFSEQAKREITEQYWMVVEWFYRHWDRAPKERSWDIIVRSDVLGNKDGNAEKILPPKGSIYGVYKYMVDGGIIRDQGYMFDKEIAAGLGRSVYTIEPDLRALSGHLNLIEKVGGSDEGYAYSLTGKAAAMSEKILPLLERFRADDLRPSGVDLDRFYEEEIAPILDPDEEDVRIVASLASFGHGTNEVTEVTTLVGPVMGMTDILRETMKGDPSIREKMKDVLENVTLLHSSLNTFFDLYSKASMAVRGNTLNKIDAKRWRNDAVEALRNVKSSFKALAQGRVLNREDIPEKDMFRVIMEQLKGDAIQALEDRVRLMKGELSGDVVDLNDLLNKFDDTIRIKEGKMLRKSFRLTRSDAPVLVRGNEISLLSMICNIASNGACYAYAARGDDAKVDIRLSVDGGEAVLTISDNGPGMAEEGIAKLEKPFYTTGGTGIGMTESRSTARMHGGKILIKSKEGEGSTFEIRLPLARGVTGDEFESDGFKDNKESSIERRIEDLKERMDEFSPAEQMKLAVHFNEIYAEFIENPLSSWARGKGMGYDELFDLARAPVRWLRIIENERELDFIEKISRVPAAELEDMFAERFPLASRVFQGGVNLRNMKRFAYEGRGADAAENLEDIYSMLKFLLDAGMPDRVRQMKLREALFVLLEWMYRHWDNDPKDNSYRSMISGAEDLSLSRVFSERLVSPGGMTAGKREAVRGVIDPAPISITLEKAGAVLPELVNSLITAAYKNEKLVLAIDDDIASGWTREELDHVITALSRLSSRDDQLGSFLRNMVIRRGRGAELAKNLSSMVEKGGVRKEDIMVLAKSSNIPFFKEFEDASTITAIDDRIMTEELYYPLLEITLFTVARAVGYSKEKLVECYRGIPNIDMLDESVICGLCWDDAAGRPRATVLIRLIPGAARAEDKGLYRALAEYIAAAA